MRHFLFWALLLAAALGIVYQHCYHCPFIFDDLPTIDENPHLQHLWPIWEAMTVPKNNPISGRPLVALTLAVNYQISGKDPWSYHAGNVLLHYVNALLLLAVLRRVFALPLLRRWLGGPGNETAPALAADGGAAAPFPAADLRAPLGDFLAGSIALLWAVHPLLTEAVVYVTQRTELMVSFFYLATVYAALRSFTTTRPLAWQAVAVAASAMGMACKEVMVGAPLFVFLLDRTLVAGDFRALLRKRKGFYLFLAATWLVLAGILLTNPRGESVGYSFGISGDSYLRTQMKVLTFYLQACFWPTGLAIYHEFPIATSWGPVLAESLLIGGIMLATAGFLFWPGGGARRGWGLAGAWAIFILAPSSSIVPIVTEVAAERRMYLPLAAVVTVVVLGVVVLLRWLNQGGRSRHPAPTASAAAPPPAGPASTPIKSAPASQLMFLAALGVCLAPSAGLGALSHARIHDYRSEQAIWEAAVREYPHSAMLLNLLAMNYQAAGRENDAYALAQKAVAANPRFADAQYQLGRLQMRRSDFAGAEKSFHAAVEALPRHHQAWLGLAEIALARHDLPLVAQFLAQARSFVGDHPDVLTMEGRLATAQGNFPQALQDFDRILADEPTNNVALFFLGQTLERMQRFEDAVKVYRDILHREPNDPETNHALGMLYLRGGDLAAARHCLESAVRQRPDAAASQMRLAWVLAVQGDSTPADWARARELAAAAVAATAGRDPAALDAQSVALARLGLYDQAITAITQASQVAQSLGMTAILPAMARRLALYQQHQPYYWTAPAPPATTDVSGPTTLPAAVTTTAPPDATAHE